jgi:hypothetical protein
MIISECKTADGLWIQVNELRAKMVRSPVKVIIPTNNPALATQMMDMQLAKCRLGVAYIDILKIQSSLMFGRYNDRPQVEREVSKLLASFKKEGILAMREDTAIPIIVSSTRLKSGFQLAPNFNEEEEVPQLQLKDPRTIVVASGQHRVAALKKYSKNVKDEIASIEKRRHKISEMKKPTEEHIAEYNCLHSKLGELQGVLVLMGKWGIIVYNEGKQSSNKPHPWNRSSSIAMAHYCLHVPLEQFQWRHIYLKLMHRWLHTDALLADGEALANHLS